MGAGFVSAAGAGAIVVVVVVVGSSAAITTAAARRTCKVATLLEKLQTERSKFRNEREFTHHREDCCGMHLAVLVARISLLIVFTVSERIAWPGQWSVPFYTPVHEQ